MKKLIRLAFLFASLFALSSCTIRLSTTIEPPGNGHAANTVDTPVEIPYDELSLEEKMAYKSVIDLVPATDYNAELLAPAQDTVNELWGFINLQGEWIIPAKYKAVHPFEGDYAAVLDMYGDYVFIDRTGAVKYITYGKKALKSFGTVSEDMLAVSVDVTSKQSMLYIDQAGKAVINVLKLPVTRGISYSTKQFLAVATPFRNGKALVMRTTNADLAENNVSNVQEIAYIIDKEGKVLSSIPQGMDVGTEGFDDNMRVVVKNAAGLCGLADEFGALVIPCSYLRVLHCEGSLYLVCNQSGFWGFMDKDGNKVVDFIYQNALPFSEGLAAVYNGLGWGFINEAGELVIDHIFDDVKAHCSAVCGGEENNGAFEGGVAVVQKGAYWGIIDKEGNILLAAEAQSCPVVAVRGKYLSFEYNGACGVFTTEAKYVLTPQFKSVGEFR